MITPRDLARWLVTALGHPNVLRWLAPTRLISSLGKERRVPCVIESSRILIIRPDEIGDMVLLIPFLKALNSAVPTAQVTLLGQPGSISLLEHCPHLKDRRSLPFSGSGSRPRYLLKLAWAVLRLKWDGFGIGGFDLVVLPRRESDWYGATLVAHLLAGRGIVVAHADRILSKLDHPPILPRVPVRVISNPAIQHEVEHTMWLLSQCGVQPPAETPASEIWLTDQERDDARTWISRILPIYSRLVVVHPSGGRSALKQWPVSYFVRLVEGLADRTDYNILIIVGPDERHLAVPFSALGSARVRCSVGDRSLRQLAAVMSEATIFVGCDSGPMHLAAAVGIPVLGIFGPSSEARFRPWSKLAQVISLRYDCSPDRLGTYQDRCTSCRFAENRCLIELPTEAVLDRVLSMLAGLDDKPGDLCPGNCMTLSEG